MTAPGRPLRLVVADDHPLMRKAITDLLTEHGHRVVAELESAAGLGDVVASTRPDVVILDVRMPPTKTDEGLRAALDVRRDFPGTGVLLLSMDVETRHARELLAELGGDRGGIGYLLKERADGVAFVDIVREIGRGWRRIRQSGGAAADDGNQDTPTSGPAHRPRIGSPRAHGPRLVQQCHRAACQRGQDVCLPDIACWARPARVCVGLMLVA